MPTLNERQLEHFCQLVAAMPDKQVEIAKRYGVAKSSVSYWVKIGNDQRLFYNVKLLPQDQQTLYQLTTLPEMSFKYWASVL